ncbi:hypothetical protein OAB59_02385 [Pelagibacteraceae bacterium]|nr:hypothetical protein [Pelagibacteraceae bacterium]
MRLFKKKLTHIFFITYFIIGALTSLNVGISHDEFHEQENWKYNINLTENLTEHFFSNKEYDKKFDNYKDKYYGIGFQVISQPIQHLLTNFIIAFKDISPYGAKLIAKHLVVFSFFFISSFFLFLILKKIVDNNFFCYFTMIIYLSYPYLFGQSLFSPKDIPFLSIWIICTYLSLSIFEKLLSFNSLKMLDILLLAVGTSFLLSIRIAGVLIFFQYLISFVIFINYSKSSLLNFIKKFYFEFLSFLFLLIIFVYILYPVFWINPFSLFAAIKQMGNFYNDVCTKTLGTCMYAKDLPSTYIPIWLSVKLPFFVLVGIFLIPFTEKKIFTDPNKAIFFGSILGAIIVIPLILIFKKVYLYDEIRHIMFLIPLLFVIGSVSLYFFSKKIFYAFGLLTLSIFVFENIKIHPYQYVWFNIPSRYMDLPNKFELDYQGLSGREIAKKISSRKENLCILVSPSYSITPFLDEKKLNCIDNWQLIDTNYKRPFLAVQHVRNIKKGMPYKCELVHEEGFKLLFHKKKFVTGKLLKCS